MSGDKEQPSVFDEKTQRVMAGIPHPVVVTNGKVTHVLVPIEVYEKRMAELPPAAPVMP